MILPSAPVRHRNGDIEYAYRQDSHFYYLSGFSEPDAVAVLVPGRPQAEYLLFVRERDTLRESWDGARAGTEGAVEHYGADDAFPIEDIDEILPRDQAVLRAVMLHTIRYPPARAQLHARACVV